MKKCRRCGAVTHGDYCGGCAGAAPLVCEHGGIKRQCPICERDEEIAALRARVAELEAAAQPVGTFIPSDTHPPPYTTAREEVAWLRGLGEKEAAALNEEFQRAELAEARVAELEAALADLVQRWRNGASLTMRVIPGDHTMKALADQLTECADAVAALAAARKEEAS